MKASLFGPMGYSERGKFPDTWPIPASYHDPKISVQSYQEGMEECEFAEEMGFEWVSFSEHHYSGRIATGNPALMAAAVAERCKKVKIALLGQLLSINNPVKAAEEIGMLDNLTNGRVIMGFLRGTPNEDQSYGFNPAEGRGRLLEAMDLVIKALTEPQPFSWEGRYYQYRTVSVWPQPVQKPMPPVIVATRSDDSVKFAADHQLGLGISFIPVEQMAKITDKYYQWCQEAGWEPGPDQTVYRASIYLAETDQKAEEWFESLRGPQSRSRLGLSAAVEHAVQTARTSQPGAVYNPNDPFDLRNVVAGSPEGDVVGPAPALNFMGGPDTVVKQIQAVHDQCGTGVVDLFFQQPKVSHSDVMRQIELFGREVLPRIKEF